MRKDKFGQFILDEADICDLYLQDPDRKLKRVLVEHNINFPDFIDELPDLHGYIQKDISVAEFDNINQTKYCLPKTYVDMDIAKFILDQCKNDDELQRAGKELLMFQERNMFMLLKYLKYLVDTMRQHNIVWGVGRGSSVSSFVLFLLGVHKINSLYYDLDIEEFLK